MKNINWYYKFLVCFLIFFIMFFTFSKSFSDLYYKSFFTDIIDYISVPFNFLDKYNIFKYKSVLDENERLEKELISISFDYSNYNNKLEENEKYKDLLSLKDDYSNYNIIFSKVIIRNKISFFDTITINKGFSDGIKDGDVVISSYGLVGYVYKASKNSSKVYLITNNKGDGISCYVKKDKSFRYGVINSYKDPYLIVELTSSSKNINAGDYVYTSGLGNFPKNIKIGQIEKIKKDSYGLVNYLYVKPFHDMNDIDYLGVISK